MYGDIGTHFVLTNFGQISSNQMEADYAHNLDLSPTKYTQYCLISTTVIFLVLVVLIFSQNFSTNGPYVVLNFCNVSDTVVLFFERKSYTDGKFTGETEKSAPRTEVDMKYTKNV